MSSSERWNAGGRGAPAGDESDGGRLLVGPQSSGDAGYGAGRPRPQSLISRLSFRISQSVKLKPVFNDGQVIDEHPDGGEVGGSLSDRVMSNKDSHDDMMTKVELRREFARAGRVSPWQKVHQLFYNYIYTDEETMVMEQQSTRQKLMNHEIRQLDVFDRLRAVYKVPPASKTYDTTTPYRLLFRSDNVLKLVLMRIDFWFLLLAHILIVVYYARVHGEYALANGPDQGPSKETNWPRLSTSMVAIPGSLLSFFFVFYNNQSYNRFMDQYWHTQRQLGAMTEFTLLLRVLVPDDLFEGAKQFRTEIWHLIHATHLLGFTGLPQQRSQDIDRWAWLYAHERKLLNNSQIQRLKPLLDVGAGNQPFKETLTWVLTRIRELEVQGYIEPQAAANLNQSVWNFRGNIDVLYGHVFQPIPFGYFHLANTILIAYLMVLSYTFTFVSPYFSVLGYCFILLAFMGLRELSSVLADPFGGDDTDIPVFDHVNNMLKNMAALIDLPVTAELDHVPLPSLGEDESFIPLK